MKRTASGGFTGFRPNRDSRAEFSPGTLFPVTKENIFDPLRFCGNFIKYLTSVRSEEGSRKFWFAENDHQLI